MKRIMRSAVAMLSLAAFSTKAENITLSWQSNGVLRVEGMEPGTTGIVEAVSHLGETFTNGASFFDAEYSADSNGVLSVALPMFFRVKGTPATPAPEVLVEIPSGINSGINPLGDGEFYDWTYPETYALTNAFSFYMDATEVTKAQWDTVYNWATNHGYSFSNSGSGKETDHPVHTVNWYDCVKWCNARSEMAGKTPCYTVSGSTYKSGESTPDSDLDAGGYRLPTSDEWEYAARSGLNSKRFPWGDTITHSEANYYSSSSFSYDISPTSGFHPNYDDGAYPYTSPVGDFAANGYGIYDMSGNLREWCTDWHPVFVGSHRVLRGGSFAVHAMNARCGYINYYSPDNEADDVGFRTVVSAN